MKEFIVGKKYKCVNENRKDLWGVVFECTRSGMGEAFLISDTEPVTIDTDNAGRKGVWQVEDFEEVQEVKTRTDFRKGDRVYCMHYGWGVVFNIVKSDEYPVHVEFNRGWCCAFKEDGRVFDDWQNRILFFEKPIISNLKECTEKKEGHIITIDGKEVRLSEESFQALKEQFR